MVCPLSFIRPFLFNPTDHPTELTSSDRNPTVFNGIRSSHPTKNSFNIEIKQLNYESTLKICKIYAENANCALRDAVCQPLKI